MATYIYDAEADALQVLLVDESNLAIDRTVELAPNVHVDLDESGHVVAVEFLYPSRGAIDTKVVEERYGVKIVIPFNFAA